MDRAAGLLARLVGGERLVVAGKRLAVGRQMQRLAVREQRHQLAAAHARPRADVADVEMHEGRARLGIVADAAALHLERGRAQLRQRHAGNVEVHRLAEHVLALLGDARRAAAQHGVGGRRAIGGDDVDVVARADGAVDLPHQIEQARVHVGRLVAPPVAQELVDLLEALLIVAPVALVYDLGPFLGVDEIELEAAGLRTGLAGEGKRGERRQNERCQPFRPENPLEPPRYVSSCKNAQNLSPCGLAL